MLVDPNIDPRLLEILSKVVVEIPALREHLEDIPLLVNKILHDLAEKEGGKVKEINLDAIETLGQYDWPGIIQLRNVIRSLAFSTPVRQPITAEQVNSVLHQIGQNRGWLKAFDFSFATERIARAT